jgi:hypothetical protein
LNGRITARFVFPPKILPEQPVAQSLPDRRCSENSARPARRAAKVAAF